MLPAIPGGDEPKYSVLGEMERAWAEFWSERVPEEMKQQCDRDNVEVLKRVFFSGFYCGAKRKERQ